jgi:hypothetical protein
MNAPLQFSGHTCDTGMLVRRFLLIGAFLLAAGACSSGHRSTHWQVEDGADPHIDKRTFTMTMESDDVISPTSNAKAELIIACDPASYTLFVQVPSEFAASFPSTGVDIGKDDAPTTSANWMGINFSDGGFGMSPEGPSGYASMAVIQWLRGAKTFHFSYTPTNRAPRKLSFDIRGMDSLLTRAERTCDKKIQER